MNDETPTSDIGPLRAKFAQDYYTFPGLNSLAERIATCCRRHGFDSPTGHSLDQHLLMAVGEIVEAQEEVRSGHAVGHVYFREDGKPEGFGVEIADAIIRLLNIAHANHIDIADLVKQKMTYNESRPYRHGRKF